MGELCVKHDVVIVSDEIHWDFAFPKKNEKGEMAKHIPIASVSQEIANNTRVSFIYLQQLVLYVVYCYSLLYVYTH